MPRPAKRAKLLLSDASSADGSTSSSELESESMGAGRDGPQRSAVPAFTVNAEYAKRFEHNKKREERQRLEEKLKPGLNGKRRRPGEEEWDDEDDGKGSDSSTDESEDDDAELATADLDMEIFDTLSAIKNKDPRVYDPNVKFYRDFEADVMAEGLATKEKREKDKPMYLHDYHRENLLAGNLDGNNMEEEEDAPPRTYQQEQDALKRELVGSMHAATTTTRHRPAADSADAEKEEEEEEEEDENFLVAKSKPTHSDVPTTTTNTKPKSTLTNQDIQAADHDPETYLSNFMAARAWLPASPKHPSHPALLDSDDSADDARADAFEHAYNMRFEDPRTANETLRSFARDVGKYGVRREEKGGRARARERETERKESERRERAEDRARLRKLKIEEAEAKVERIREAAGLKGKEGVEVAEWREVLEGDFSEGEWEKEMRRRFGDAYYAEREGEVEGAEDEEMVKDGDETKRQKKVKVRKPQWEDDIDIKDLVPDFRDEVPNLAPSDDEDDANDAGLANATAANEVDKDFNSSSNEAAASTRPRPTKKARLQAKTDAKRLARRQRQGIEDLVDTAILPVAAASGAAGFRYRATSPTSFGLTARDILFADDAQLNSFAGLKKLAPWREEERKRRDKKKLGKKARVREWRRETFGREGEPGVGAGPEEGRTETANAARDVKQGEEETKKKRKKRAGKGKSAIKGDSGVAGVA